MTRAPRENAAATATQALQAKRPATAKIGPESALGTAVSNREVLGVGGVLALQAAAGNRAVAGLVQAKRAQPSTEDSARVHEAAKLGIGGASGELPHLETIQRSFGRHDVTGVVAHTGAQATAGAQAMGAAAFAMGNHVAFAGSADLRTAAHEAAHVVQQRAGVQLAGGVGQVGDRHERHADAVAEEVVRGRSAEGLLDRASGVGASSGRSGSPVVQGKFEYVGFKSNPKEDALGEAVEVLVTTQEHWRELGEDKNITVFISVDDSSSPNPAEITNPVKDTSKKGHWVFVLQIRRWFIESHPPGYVIGVMNHELGVHALPYIKKIKENAEAELDSRPPPHDEKALTAKEKGGKDDHRRAMDKGTAEFTTYFNLAVGSADALKKAGKAQEAEDVLFSYLMDLAAMAPSGDKGIIAMKAMVPSPLQQGTYEYVLGRYNALAQHLPQEWRALMPKMTTKDVERTFLDFRSKIPKKKAVTFAAIAILILILLVVWISKSFL